MTKRHYETGDAGYVETPQGDFPLWFANHSHSFITLSVGDECLAHWDGPNEILSWACVQYGIDPYDCAYHDGCGNIYLIEDEEW